MGMMGSVSLDVIKRILNLLNEKEMKKTNLALRAGLNYNVCLRYLRLLQQLGWIRVEVLNTISSSQQEYIYLSQAGKDFFNKLGNIAQEITI
jgi:predicted transcriptional regulator